MKPGFLGGYKILEAIEIENWLFCFELILSKSLTEKSIDWNFYCVAWLEICKLRSFRTICNFLSSQS